jgi:glycosyltransferase involved in cell wall biosynthesis
MSRVLISGLFIHPGKVGGAEKYFYNILKGFEQLGLSDYFTLLLNKNYPISSYDPIIERYAINWVAVNYNRAIYDYGLELKKYTKGYKKVFNPNYITPLYSFNKISHITTIHDLQYLHYPEFFSKTKRLFQYLSHRHTLARSKAVVAISEFVREDILDKFGLQYASKVFKIPVPISLEHLQNKVSTPMYPFSYILSVSAWFPHKNLINLVRAFRAFQELYSNDLKLILVGQNQDLRGGNYQKYHQELSEEIARTPNIVFTGYIDDASLGNIYQHCLFFVFPSLFEGFGMPVIEAMALGKPTLTTRCGSLAEVSLNQAIYIDNPLDTKEWTQKIKYMFDNQEFLLQQFASIAPQIQKLYLPASIASDYAKLLLD